MTKVQSNIINIDHINNDSLTWCKNLKQYGFLEKFSDLISSIIILSLDIIYLIGEVFHNMPINITNFAFVSLNFVGIIALPFYIHSLNKCMQDMFFAKKLNNNKIFYVGFIKTFLMISNVFLLSTSFFAAILRMKGLINLTNCIYSITIPLGSISLITMIALDVFHYYNNKKLLVFLKYDKLNMIDTFAQLFDSSYIKNKKKDHQIYAEIHETMDKDTLNIVKQNLLIKNNPFKKRKLFNEVIYKNIQTQQFVAYSDFLLKILGYVSIFFANLFIGTKFQAVIWTSMAFLYTCQLSIQKINQYKEQKKISMKNSDHKDISMVRAGN